MEYYPIKLTFCKPGSPWHYDKFTLTEFLDHTFVRLKKLLKGGPVLKVSNILITEDTTIAIVEMIHLSYSINDKPFNNTYCWIVKFENEIIVHVRAYLDSALVQALVNEN